MKSRFGKQDVIAIMLLTKCKQYANFYKTLLNSIVMLIMLVFTSHASALTAQVDRLTLPENESLMLEVSGEFSAFNLSINLKPLEKDFKILDTRRNSSVQWVNGNFASQTTLAVTLEPRRKGNLTIPSITIDGESTAPIEIQVTKANTLKNDIADSPIALEVTLDNDTSWVNAQNILTVTIYNAVKVYNPELLGISELENLDIRIEKLGENKKYRAKRNNKTYDVTELRYLFYPNNPGKIDFSDIVFQGQVASNNSRFGQKVRVEADKVTLDVKPIPANYPSKSWIPAKNLIISDDLDSEISIDTGETINRNIVVSVEGQESAVIPMLPTPDSKLISLYEDTPELNDQKTESGITGVRIDSQAIITKQSGTLELPEIKIPWFNTDTAKVEIATLPARTLKINGQVTPETATTPASPLSPPQSNATPLTDDVDTANPSTTNISQDGDVPSWAIWLIAILFILVILLAGAVLYLFTRQNKHNVSLQTSELSDSAAINIDFSQLSTCSYAEFSLKLNRLLKQNQLELNQLSASTMTLIEKFRQSEYAAGTEQSVDQGFTQTERTQLKSELESYFNSKLQTEDDQVKLYPS